MTTELLVLKGIFDLLQNHTGGFFELYDLYLGQYADEEGNLLYDAPAALVELSDTDWTQMGGGLQQGLLRFAIHIVDETGYDDVKMRLNTTHFDHVQAVYTALNLKRVRISDVSNLPNDSILMNTIVRKNSRYVNDLRENVATIVRFESIIIDYSATDIWQDLENVDLNVPFHLVHNLNEFKAIINGT